MLGVTLRFGVKTVWLEYLVFFMFVSLEFKEEVLRKKYEEETGSQAEERARQEAEEHRALMAWNNEENLRMLKARWAEKMKNMNTVFVFLPLAEWKLSHSKSDVFRGGNPFRILRVQKEAEEAERKKIEAAIQREQEQQEFIKEKEREILRLQVGFVSASKLCK